MSLSMLHCDGEKIINTEEKQVFLRGTNLGGWLLDELWQGFFKGGEAQWDIVTTLENRFGKEEADRLIKIRCPPLFLSVPQTKTFNINFIITFFLQSCQT